VLLREGKVPITKITDSVINDFPAVKVDWFTEDQNKQFRSLHKELLQTSRDKNNCFETAFIVSGDLSRKTIVFGDETTISIPPLSTGLKVGFCITIRETAAFQLKISQLLLFLDIRESLSPKTMADWKY